MKESLIFIFFIFVFKFVIARETKLLIDLMKHGISAPRYTQNSEYKVTDNTYNVGPGELTDKGVFQMKQYGNQLREKFINNNMLLPDKYNPQNFEHMTYDDEPSVLSSYSSMLGAYPDSLSWIDYQKVGGPEEYPPFDKEDELHIRNILKLNGNPSQSTTKDMTVQTSGDGKTLFNDPRLNCPQLQTDFDENLEQAYQKYTNNKKFSGLYEDVNETFKRDLDKINFKTAHLYLDDYRTSKANEMQVPQFEEPVATDAQINSYYKSLEYEGKYGTSTSDARVVSHPFLKYVLTTMYGKNQVLKGGLNSSRYEKLKYAQFIGNENAITAATKLFDVPVSRDPDFGSALRFELYESQGEDYVKATYNDKPISIGGRSDGIMKYEDFMDNLYEKLYFGNIDNYCAGRENIASHINPTSSNYSEYLKEQNSEFRVPETQAVQQTQVVEQTPVVQNSQVIQATPLQSSPVQVDTTPKHEDQGWFKQEFIEIEQFDTPKQKSEPKVIEIFETREEEEPKEVEQPQVVEQEPPKQVVQQAPVSVQPQVQVYQAPVIQQPVVQQMPIVQQQLMQAPVVQRQVAPISVPRQTQYASMQTRENVNSADVIDVDFKRNAEWDKQPENM